MTNAKKTVAAVVAALFPKSQKAISEKLATDEFNAFAAEASELDQRLDAQGLGNVAEQTDRQKAEAQVTDLTGQLTAANTQIGELQAQVGTLTTEKETAATAQTDLQTKLTASEEYVTKLKASINPVADEDASNALGSEDTEILTETDREARASFKR